VKRNGVDISIDMYCNDPQQRKATPSRNEEEKKMQRFDIYSKLCFYILALLTAKIFFATLCLSAFG
jgi:hypothetical protein